MEANKINNANNFVKENKHKLNKEYRMNYHLMGEYGWINDPNGFIQYKGMYHLYYQHYPYESVWGPMHWGHAISQDMIKWTYLPIALAPDREYDINGCFSGSAIEKDNMMFLLYTGNTDLKQTQCLAYSEDGINFTKSEYNPVIDIDQLPENTSNKDSRDPKLFKSGESYYAVIGSNDGNNIGQVLLYKSRNLVQWNFVNIIAKGTEETGIGWECPDLFKIDHSDVLIVSPMNMKKSGNDYNNHSSSIYMIGKFDINYGILKYEKYYPIDNGFDFYAPQTIVDSKGRRLLIGWMDMWESSMPTQKNGHNWAGAMTLPREIILKNDRLYFKPIIEIEKYRKTEFSLYDITINGEQKIKTSGDSYELELVFDKGDSIEFGLKLRAGEFEETELSYSNKDNIFRFNRDKSGIGPKGERRTEIDLIEDKLKLQIFVDKCSLEIFINDGEKVMSGRIYPSRDSIDIKVFSKGNCKILYLKKWDL